MQLTKFLALLLGWSLMAADAALAETQAEPQLVKVGVFISNLYDVDIARQDVGAQFWVWYNHTDPSFDPKTDIEIVNARTSEIQDNIRDDMGSGRIWDQVKYSTVLDQNWDVANYPFDR